MSEEESGKIVARIEIRATAPNRPHALLAYVEAYKDSWDAAFEKVRRFTEMSPDEVRSLMDDIQGLGGGPKS